MPDPNESSIPKTCLIVEDLWKIFGFEKKTISDEYRRMSKKEVQEKTNSVLGLRNIHFDVKQGEFFVIMGLSGSGKSTLIRCLLRLIEPTRGSIYINGDDICLYDKNKLMELRRHITSMVFQHFGLLPHYSVLENAAYGLKVRGESTEKRHKRARKALETVGLKGWEKYKPGALSGGMQQRVGLARALANDPQILLMDEPFSGLDPLIRKEMQDELIELQKILHKTIIFVTHDLHEAMQLGDRIAIMKDGEILQLGSPEEIITNPANDYVKQFVQNASPTSVLTAGSIMEKPKILLSEDQDADTAMKVLKEVRLNHAFLVGKDDRLKGLVTTELLYDSRANGESLDTALIKDYPTSDPDQVIEDIIPMAVENQYPIPVVDETGRFLGEITSRTILRHLITKKEEVISDV